MVPLSVSLTCPHRSGYFYDCPYCHCRIRHFAQPTYAATTLVTGQVTDSGQGVTKRLGQGTGLRWQRNTLRFIRHNSSGNYSVFISLRVRPIVQWVTHNLSIG